MCSNQYGQNSVTLEGKEQKKKNLCNLIQSSSGLRFYKFKAGKIVLEENAIFEAGRPGCVLQIQDWLQPSNAVCKLSNEHL